VAYVLSAEITLTIGDEFTVDSTCAFMPREVPQAWKSQHSLEVFRACRSEPRTSPPRLEAMAQTGHHPGDQSGGCGNEIDQLCGIGA
jgi:hypothetical protein